MKKKFRIIAVVIIAILSVSGFGTFDAHADVVTKRGKISYYNPTKPGSDGKTMTESDCAVDKNYSYLPKGTAISAYNLDNGASKVLEKWDYGDFEKYGVILDVLPKTFKALGGNVNNGYIKNAMIQWKEPFGFDEITEE
ncbi:hypothetical protein [Lysinibacillus xylanilyticus]|uniref:hypothetical protein n=1 Tax=Lysinibacillus xylanilyticus TaxID=582475 RepID=UPI003822AD63